MSSNAEGKEPDPLAADRDLAILTRVCRYDDFSRSVLIDDRIDDWLLVKELGELLINIWSEDLFGHLAIARACRHLNDLEAAAGALAVIQSLIESGRYLPLQLEALSLQIEKERRFIGKAGEVGKVGPA